MAEGIEEAENNSDGGSCTDDNTTKTMLGAIMPCETINSSPTSLGGGIKREFDIYPSVATAAVAATATSTTSSVSSITPNPSIASPSAISISPIPQQQHHHHHQDQQPINLKSEFHESDKDLDSSPAQSPMSCNNNNDRNSGNNNLTSLLGAQLLGAAVDRQSIAPDHAKAAAAVAAAQVHMNGTMQGMLNLQKLQQNLAQLQQQSSLAGLQGLAAGLSSSAGLNSPLNLSVGSPSPISNALPGGGPFGVGGTGQMPQLILASGQLVQGVQGAQLLIPTSQGIATQTILTIPVSQQINSNEQIVQSLAALNNGAASLRNLSQLQQQHQQLSAAAVVAQSDLLNPGLFPTNVQQLLSVLQPQLFNAAAVQQQTQRNQHTESHSPHHQQLVQQQQSQQSQSSSRQSDISRQETSPKHSPARSSSSYDKQLLIDTVPSSLSISSSVAQTRNSPNYNQLSNGHGSRESRQEASSPLHHLRHRSRSPASNAMSRLAATNGEITITKSHGPLSHGSSSSASQNHHTSSAVLSQQQQQSMSSLKLSPPSSMHLSPTGSDNSSNDMLDDSPNEPTINQTNCNVVDGIDLDEIKEFAKAFKLRRLSLGLTQTQVGQALSVTEGPAYSQSAICSALAAQMYAAQLSSQQQQNMFEKLDITPKSAQKIKPVLERWMKEAEESHWNRYKSGQNHLTDFIGVEPSKKRKRRTSFTPQALELLNAHFERNTHPSGTEITGLAHQLGYEREVIRIWFCNKRQALKNTVRMMSKGIV